MGRGGWLAVWLALTVAGCGRLGFDPNTGFDAGMCGSSCPDAAVPRDAGMRDAAFDAAAFDGGVPPRDAGPPRCADLGGRACTVNEACFVELVTTSDVAQCCPGSDCVGRGDSIMAEALRTEDPIVIDGSIADWSSDPRWPITKVSVGATPTTADLSGYFSARWDDTQLYVLIHVTDDVLRPIEAGLAWQDDSAEIYVDMDVRTRDTTWDGDETWFYVRQNNTAQKGAEAAVLFPTNVRFGTEAGGWFFEAAITWPSIPPSGTVIGFDVAVNDDDGPAGASRTNQRFWNDTTGELYHDASVIGLLRVSSSTTSSGLPVCGDTSCEPGENATNCPLDC